MNLKENLGNLPINSNVLEDFIKNHCKTISKNNYVPVSVKDYEHLSIINLNLLSAIRIVGEMIPNVKDIDEITHVIDTLVHLLSQFSLHEECLGLTELLEK